MPKKKPRSVTGLTRKGKIAMVALGVGAVVMLIVAGRPSEPVHVPAEAAEAQPQRAVAADLMATKPAAPAKRAPAARPRATQPVASKPAVVRATATGTATTGVMAAAAAPAAVPAANTLVRQSDVVTITGCLEEDEGTFKLTETAGEEAPKSRSWKSGFLRSRSASIDIVDAPNRLRLPTHVGQRVSLTGLLSEREMNVRSLHRVGGEPCD